MASAHDRAIAYARPLVAPGRPYGRVVVATAGAGANGLTRLAWWAHDNESEHETMEPVMYSTPGIAKAEGEYCGEDCCGEPTTDMAQALADIGAELDRYREWGGLVSLALCQSLDGPPAAVGHETEPWRGAGHVVAAWRIDMSTAAVSNMRGTSYKTEVHVLRLVADGGNKPEQRVRAAVAARITPSLATPITWLACCGEVFSRNDESEHRCPVYDDSHPCPDCGGGTIGFVVGAPGYGKGRACKAGHSHYDGAHGILTPADCV